MPASCGPEMNVSKGSPAAAAPSLLTCRERGQLQEANLAGHFGSMCWGLEVCASCILNGSDVSFSTWEAVEA